MGVRKTSLKARNSLRNSQSSIKSATRPLRQAKFNERGLPWT